VRRVRRTQGNTTALLGEALVEQRAGRVEAAERLYRRVLAREPGHAEALHLLGLVLHQRGDTAQAIASIARAVEAQPNALYLNNLGALHRAVGALDQAEAAFRRAAALNPRDGTTLLNLGNLAVDRGDIEPAMTLFRQASEAAPRDARPLNNLGTMHHRRGQMKEAANCFRAALARAPAYAEAACNLATVLSDAGRPEEAEAAWRNALVLVPASADGHNGHGSALHALGRFGEAEAAFDAALRHRPGWPDALRNLGVARAAQERWDEAIEAYHAAARGAPQLEGLDAAMSDAMSSLVPRWHFPMMNDTTRNAAYEAAIRAVVRPGDLVLEIGTGAGLLAMMAARAGAQVVTCERSATIAAAATEIVARNGLADRISVVPRSSRGLEVGRDLPRRADVLIAEVFDAGLLGENALDSLAHARAQLLQPDARIVPASAQVLAAPVESEGLRRLIRVEQVAGFDLSPFNRFARRDYEQAPLAAVPYRLLTAPIPLFAFDFATDPPPQPQLDRTVVATIAGQLDALAFWYELRLAGDHVLSTGPEAAGTHWDQAVVVLETPRSVAAGESLTIRARHDRKTIGLELLPSG
jgi:tetratricopeptide (TPR) repeat protein